MGITELSYALLREFERQAGKHTPTAREIRKLADALHQEDVEFGEIGIAAAVIGWNSARGPVVMASGYKHCDCGGCFETIVGDTDGVELCDDCEEAGCDPFEEGTACRQNDVEEAPGPEERQPCPRDTCAGEGHLQGILGRRAHYRCRACGIDFNHELD
jgi:hypothetical protein